MSKEVEISDAKIENFCINFLKDRGYIVKKAVVLETEVGELTEKDVIGRFYSRASQVKPASLNSQAFKNFERDVAVLRKLCTRFSTMGVSQQAIYKYIINLIDFLYDYPVLCGGPYDNFRIFSSESFVDNLAFQFDMNEFERDEKEWAAQAEKDFANKKYDAASFQKKLMKMRESLQNGS